MVLVRWLSLLAVLTAIGCNGCTHTDPSKSPKSTAPLVEASPIEVHEDETTHTHANPAAMANKHCQAPSEPALWESAYCMTVYETDDPTTDEVKKCVEKNKKDAPQSDDVCEINMFWKKKWCELVAQRGYVVSFESCVEDPLQYPGGVETGY